MLTGWEFDRDGRKATQFDVMCKALGVSFDLSASKDRLLRIDNTESRKQELVQQIGSCLKHGSLGKQETLVLRGRLGFADSFIHGRLGATLLKQLSEHAYGRTSKIDFDLQVSLEAMAKRLQANKPRTVTAEVDRLWYIYTDAAYEPKLKTGGLGGALVDEHGAVEAWFGIILSEANCKVFGSSYKESIIYELEMLAGAIALCVWCRPSFGNLHTWFGDNDSVRYAFMRATGTGEVARELIKYYVQREEIQSAIVWFARVPTEANISDFPSRGQEHPLLTKLLDQSDTAKLTFANILKSMQDAGRPMFMGEA